MSSAKQNQQMRKWACGVGSEECSQESESSVEIQPELIPSASKRQKRSMADLMVDSVIVRNPTVPASEQQLSRQF